MPGKPDSLQNITMSGGGAYSLATRGAEDVINSATQIVLEALDSINISENQHLFTFSDMGTADGGTSLKMVEKLIRSLQKKAPGININIVYADQPKNDFNGLVQTVMGLGSMTKDDPYNNGPVGCLGGTSANDIAKETDLAIAIGTKLSDFTTGSWTNFENPKFKLV